MIQLSRLEGFIQVARTGGYARAARAFPYPITQPGVHQQVRRLEEEIGARLFERVGKDRVVLTPEGRQLHEFVAPFIEGLPAVVAAMRGGVVSGTLRLQASGHVLRHLLPPWLRRLHAVRPDVEVLPSESHTPALSVVLSGEADLLIDHLPVIPSSLEVREVARTRPFLVVPSAHPLARRRAAPALRALDGEPFVAYGADAHLRGLQLGALARAGARPSRLLQADSAETILGFVSAGLGVSLVASLQPGGPQVEGVVALALEGRAERFPIHAAWRRSAADNPLLRAFLNAAPPPEAPAGAPERQSSERRPPKRAKRR